MRKKAGLLLAVPALVAGAIVFLTAKPAVLGRAADLETPAAGFSSAYAVDIADRLVALGPRVPESAAHAAARALIVKQLGASIPGARAVMEITPAGNRYNIFAERPGTAQGEPLMIGAHYDTVEGSPGATDDAAGVGIVLALAKTFGSGPGTRPIIFAVWDAEERKLGGSLADADHRARSARLPSAVIALDLVGWRSGKTVLHTFRDGLWVARPLAPAGLVGIMLGTARDLDIDLAVGDHLISPVYQVLTRLVRIPFDADDASYARLGVPALFVSDSSFTRFAPAYHTPLDLAETVSPEMIGRAGRLCAGALAALDAGANPGGTDSWIAFGRRQVQGLAILIVAALAGLPLLGALVGRWSGAIFLATAYAAAVALEPAAALLWLAPGVLVAPLARESRIGRWATALVAMVMPVACIGVFVAAGLRFGLLPPAMGIYATVAHVAAAVALLVFIVRRSEP